MVCHFPTTVLNSLTPTGCPVIQLISDTMYLESAQTVWLKASVPTKLLSLQMPAANGVPKFLPGQLQSNYNEEVLTYTVFVNSTLVVWATHFEIF